MEWDKTKHRRVKIGGYTVFPHMLCDKSSSRSEHLMIINQNSYLHHIFDRRYEERMKKIEKNKSNAERYSTSQDTLLDCCQFFHI